MKRFARRLVLRQRQTRTQKWAIVLSMIDIASTRHQKAQIHMRALYTLRFYYVASTQIALIFLVFPSVKLRKILLSRDIDAFSSTSFFEKIRSTDFCNIFKNIKLCDFSKILQIKLSIFPSNYSLTQFCQIAEFKKKKKITDGKSRNCFKQVKYFEMLAILRTACFHSNYL